MTKLEHFLPIFKIDEDRREVWGVAAEERVDKTDEIMDYETSKPFFQKWSQEIAEASGGKSLGNLRAMHNSIAAGKLVHIEFRDDDKNIYIGAKVVDDGEWKKVREGVYTGFSIGGDYGALWTDEATNLTRYTAIPAEISLADNPCMYGAVFDVVKNSGVEKRQFIGGDDMLRKFDLQQRIDQVRMAFYTWRMETYGEEAAYEQYPYTVLDDKLIADDGTGVLFAYPYTVADDESITFGEPVTVEIVYAEVQDEDQDDADNLEAGEEMNAVTEPEALQRIVANEVEKTVADLKIGNILKILEGVQGNLESLVSRVEVLEAQPVSDAPLLRTSMSVTRDDGTETAILEKLIDDESNPRVREALGKRLAILRMR